MPYYLGVDLGTTYTAAAVWRAGHVEIASLGTRAAVVPSVVLLREDETLLIGEAAERRALVEPQRVAREFKRRFGDPTPIMVGGTPYSAEAMMAKLLGWVVDAVAEREGGRPDAITLSHPANWGPFKLDLLQQTIRLADLDRVTTISEPEAAAIHYASQERVEPGAVVAVYDLGGGTFDAAVLRRADPRDRTGSATGWEILGEPEGIERLGGVDFDQAVLHHVQVTVGDAIEQLDPEDSAARTAMARLRQECVEAKEALASDVDVTIPVLLPSFQSDVRLTRSEFEAMIRPPLASSVDALERALRSAGVEAGEVASVLLVGGSSRLPVVAELVSSALERPVAVDAHPKHGVALGAGIVAAERGTGGAVDTEVVPSIERFEPGQVGRALAELPDAAGVASKEPDRGGGAAVFPFEVAGSGSSSTADAVGAGSMGGGRAGSGPAADAGGGVPPDPAATAGSSPPSPVDGAGAPSVGSTGGGGPGGVRAGSMGRAGSGPAGGSGPDRAAVTEPPSTTGDAARVRPAGPAGRVGPGGTGSPGTAEPPGARGPASTARSERSGVEATGTTAPVGREAQRGQSTVGRPRAEPDRSAAESYRPAGPVVTGGRETFDQRRPPPRKRGPDGSNGAEGRRLWFAVGAVVIVAVALVAAFLLVDPGDDGNGEERLDSGDPSTTAEDSPEVQEFSLSIAGVAQVTDTEIDLVRGDEVTISASGTIRDDINGHPDRFFSPEGEPDPEGLHSGDPHFGQFNHAALYGQVGDGPLFEVGESASFDVQQDGRLQLGINDGRFDDNDGSYEVVIEVTRAG